MRKTVPFFTRGIICFLLLVSYASLVQAANPATINVTVTDATTITIEHLEPKLGTRGTITLRLRDGRESTVILVSDPDLLDGTEWIRIRGKDDPTG